MSWSVVTYGDSTKPPVLCLHGFMGQGSDWETVATSLEDSFYFICPDLPGHGNTPITESDTLDTITAGLQSVLAKHNAQPVSVIGYSMGGRMALQFALEAPDQVARLVLESASPGIDSEELRASRKFHDDSLAETLVACQGDAAAFRIFLEGWYSQPVFSSMQSDADARTIAIGERLMNNPAHLSMALRQFSTGRQASHWEALDQHTIPTLCVVGEKDRKFCGIAEAMSEATPRIAVHTMADCGHNVHLERPKSYTTVIRRFLLLSNQ